VKDKIVKLCLGLRNGLSVNPTDMAQLHRKALAMGLDKDPAFHSYFNVSFFVQFHILYYNKDNMVISDNCETCKEDGWSLQARAIYHRVVGT
jgi:hypothetical protein